MNARVPMLIVSMLLLTACPAASDGSGGTQNVPGPDIALDVSRPHAADAASEVEDTSMDASPPTDIAAPMPDVGAELDSTMDAAIETDLTSDTLVTDVVAELGPGDQGEEADTPLDSATDHDADVPTPTPDGAATDTSDALPTTDASLDTSLADLPALDTVDAPDGAADAPNLQDSAPDGSVAVDGASDLISDPGDADAQATSDAGPDTTLGAGYADDLKVLAHNVYMLDELLLNWSQTERAPFIAAADYMQGHDVVLLQELFDNSARQVLLDALAAQYPYQTPVMGMSTAGWDSSEGANFNLFVEDGGIAIVSKWPIVEQVQYVQNAGCGADAFSAKGFVYAKIDKNGAPYHLISTHTQSQDSGCVAGQPEAIRATQFQAIRDWIAARNIPSDELVIIGGDFNVIKGTVEYDEMWAHLGATVPDTYVGVPYTWDPTSNSIAYYNYPELPGEYLDYVVVSADHAQPSHWHNLALDPVSPVWTANVGLIPYRWYEYSDHYPVAGFAYADASTPTQSERPIDSPYAAVDLQNEGNGLYVQADSGAADGWLYADAATPGNWTEHILERWHDPLSGCIRSGDYVTLRPSARPDHYWTWWLWLPNDGGYYTAQDNPVDRLRLEIVGDDGDCLADGDVIALRDRWTPTLTDYYVSRASDDRLFLMASAIGSDERFTVVNAADPTYWDWSGLLVY